MKTGTSTLWRASLLASASAFTLALSPLAPAANAIVPNDNLTPDDILDDGVNGVGMFFRTDGYVCTGTLINPRTVLFAAHCVNDRAESDYGTSVFSAFSFGADALPGFIDWFAGLESIPESYVYNISQIQYNPASLADPTAFGFLEGDIALATLDTPATNIPTWALLFSPLPTPEQDPVTGTGYHVNITGYGRTGSGTFGDTQGIDWRRRAAENMLGALTSFDERNTFLFGAPFGDLPQSLYRLDFDDPNKTNPFDFNLYQDEHLAGEATTAGGDSGGPLILDAANNTLSGEDLVIGVLSGGSRFFGPQSFSSYGTESFYQPLYLFYDYIAAANPYRYVSNMAADGAWEDGAHWQSDLDPNYRIIDADGNVINGFPDVAEGGTDGGEPDFGVICFDPEGYSPFDECANLADGSSVPPSRGEPPAQQATIDEGAISDNRGRIALGDLLTSDGLEGGLTLSAATSVSVDFAVDAPQAGAHPTPTIANGLPGATDFVPDNIDPDVAGGVLGRYFDVTLTGDYTTTLSSSVEVDKLTLTEGATLDVLSGGYFSSLTDINMFGGSNLDTAAGTTIATAGDLLVYNGWISGFGTIQAPYVTSVLGGFNPGGTTEAEGWIGTLTIDGDLIMSSGSVLLVHVSDTSSDLLEVTQNAVLGGTVGWTKLGTPKHGDSWTIMTVGTGTFGAFDDVLAAPGILESSLSYVGGDVILSLEAGAFLDYLGTGLSPTHQSYAAAFDVAREDNYSQLGSIYTLIDLMSPSEVLSAFDQMAPDDAILAGQSAYALTDVVTGQIRDRLTDIRTGSKGFTATASTNAVQVASADPMAAFSYAANSATSAAADAETTKSWDMKPGYGGFLDVDFFTGETTSGIAGREGDVEGFVVAAGLDRTFDDGNTFGAFVTYGQSESSIDTGVRATGDVDGFSLGAYGEIKMPGDLFLNGYLSYGNYSVETMRDATIGGSTFSAEGSIDMTGSQVGLEVGRDLSMSKLVTLTPSIALDRSAFEFDDYSESGSAIALDIQGRSLSSLLLSAGADLNIKASETGKISFNAGARIVTDMSGDANAPVIGVFSAAPKTTSVVLTGPDHDQGWYEIEAGIDIQLTDSLIGGINVKTDLDRDDLEQTIIGGSLKFEF